MPRWYIKMDERKIPQCLSAHINYVTQFLTSLLATFQKRLGSKWSGNSHSLWIYCQIQLAMHSYPSRIVVVMLAASQGDKCGASVCVCVGIIWYYGDTVCTLRPCVGELYIFIIVQKEVLKIWKCLNTIIACNFNTIELKWWNTILCPRERNPTLFVWALNCFHANWRLIKWNFV